MEPSGSRAKHYCLGFPFKLQLQKPKGGLNVQSRREAWGQGVQRKQKGIFSVLSSWIFEIQRDKWSWAVTWSLLLITEQRQFFFGSWLWVPLLGSTHTQHLVGSPQHPKVSPPSAVAGIQENQTPAESSITKSHTGVSHYPLVSLGSAKRRT